MCLFGGGRDYDHDVVVVQQPGMVQQGYAIGPNGQPMPMQGGVTVVNQGGGYGCERARWLV